MTDLSNVIGFEWEEGNAGKNELHGVSMAEAEQVFFNSPLLVLPDAKHSETKLRFHALGKTNEGRQLHISFTLERAIWEKHDSTEYLDWKKSRLTVIPNLKPSTQTISPRLPQHLLDSIKTAANARDVPYQSLIKVWLQEKLHGS